jgi:hypothetical protein
MSAAPMTVPVRPVPPAQWTTTTLSFIEQAADRSSLCSRELGALDRHFGEGLHRRQRVRGRSIRLVAIEGGQGGPGADARLVQITERPVVT